MLVPTVFLSLLLVRHCVTSSGVDGGTVNQVGDKPVLDTNHHRVPQLSSTSMSHIDRAGLELVMEPLPEVIAAKPETKILSRYWQVLVDLRRRSLLACEAGLWDRTQSSDQAVGKGLLAVQAQSETTTSPTVDHLVPVYAGREVVQEIDASLDKCFSETRTLTDGVGSKDQAREDLLLKTDRTRAQLEACVSAGGESPDRMKTLATLGRVQARTSQSTTPSEIIAALESSVVKLKLDKEACFDSLALPTDLHKYLELSTEPESVKVTSLPGQDPTI